MKSTKKVILLVICILALVTASVFGTLAYLTDTAGVTNTFTVGNVDITLDESKVTPDGEPVGDERTEEGNEYHMIPGQTYVKDPTMTVLEGSEESYVRMLVTITEYSKVLEVFGADFLPQDFVDGWDNAIWETTAVIAVDEEADTATYEFRYFETVDGSIDDDDDAETPEVPGDAVLEPLFTGFTVPGELTGEQLALIQDMEIQVVGEAIQAAGFDTVDAAWAAFEEQADKNAPAGGATPTPAP